MDKYAPRSTHPAEKAKGRPTPVEIPAFHVVEATLCCCVTGEHRAEHWIAYVPLNFPQRRELAVELGWRVSTWSVLMEAAKSFLSLRYHVGEPGNEMGDACAFCNSMQPFHLTLEDGSPCPVEVTLAALREARGETGGAG